MSFDRVRKVRSITLDTNVLLDLPEAPAYLSSKEQDTARCKRVMDSYMIARLCLAENIDIEKVGMKVVEKELSKSKALLPIFFSIFPKSLRPDRHARKLAEHYIKEIGIGMADALIVATASVNKVDVVLSWNRTDLTNETNRKKMEEINISKGVKTPLICDPTYFIDRLLGSKGRPMSLALSPSPIPKVYRLRIPEERP